MSRCARILRIAVLLSVAWAALSAVAFADEELDFGLEERRLRELDFVGNQAFDDDQLEDYLGLRGAPWYAPLGRSKYRRDRIEQGIEQIRGLYRRNGYHQVEVRIAAIVEDDQRGDTVTIDVVEGPRTLLDRLEIVHPEPLSPDDLLPLLSFREGGPAPARAADLGADLYRILDEYISRGHLGARVREELAREDSTTILRYIVRPGPVYSIRRIEISGEREVPERFIRRELRVRDGERFDARKVALSEAELLETGWFRDVGFEPTQLDTLSGEATLRLRVVERPTAFWEIGLGTGTKDRLRLTAAWGDRNVLRSGRGLTVRGRVLGVIEGAVEDPGRNELFVDHEEEAIYRHPHFLGTRFTVNTTVFFQKESRPRSALELQRLGLLLNSILYTGERSTVELELGSTRVRKLSLSDQIDFGNERATTRSLSLVLRRDTRDDLFHPTRGNAEQLLLQTAGGPVLVGDNDFHKALVSAAQYVPLPSNSVLALRAQAGWVEAWHESYDRAGPTRGVPVEERFFAGGSNSVRGYRESALGPRLDASDFETVRDPRFLVDRLSGGGDAMLLLNAELRVPIPVLSRWGFEAVSFFDSGNVWSSWARFSPDVIALRGDVEGDRAADAYRTSYGFGVHYRTVVGPLRLEYGIPLRRATFETLDDTGAVVATDRDPDHVWHLSLGHAF